MYKSYKNQGYLGDEKLYKKLTYFVCSFCLIHTKETEKIKTNILIRVHTKRKFIRKKGNLSDLYASLN